MADFHLRGELLMAILPKTALPTLLAGAFITLACVQQPGESLKPAGAQELATSKEQPGETQVSKKEKPFWDNAQAFVDAYARRDAEAIGALFSEDAVFLDEFGQRIEGRKAIVEMARAAFAADPDLAIHAMYLENVRFTSPTVAVEEGIVVTSDSASGPQFPSRYVAVHVRTGDGKWRINTFKDFPREEGERLKNLAQLAWLVGDWVHESLDARVHSKCAWSEDGNYLIERFTASTSGGGQLAGEQRIGWDAANRQLRSWTFDSEGGFFQRTWSRQGEQWIAKTTGVTGDGQPVSATAVYAMPNRETIVWRYRDLKVGGADAEDIQPVVMTRRPPQPKEETK
jgi:uncharacterized protein (TIGR02246 family)